MTDEDRLSAPLHRDGLSGRDGANVEFSRGQCQHVCGGAHGGNELYHEDTCGGGVCEADTGEEEVGEGTAFGFGDAVDAIICEGVIDGAEFVEGGSLGSWEGGGNVGCLGLGLG